MKMNWDIVMPKHLDMMTLLQSIETNRRSSGGSIEQGEENLEMISLLN